MQKLNVVGTSAIGDAIPAAIVYHKHMKQIIVPICACVCAALFAGCGGLYSGHLFGVEGPETSATPNSKGGVYSVKNSIGVAAAAVNEVKEADAFYILIFNESPIYIEYDRDAVTLLDQDGKEHKQLSRSRVRQLRRRYKTLRPPIGFRGDVFSERGLRLDRGDRVSPLNPADVLSSKVMPKSRFEFFVFFPRKSAKSDVLHLKIPQVIMGNNGDELVYIFRFEKQTE